jgi:hypothetical protein
MRKVTGATRYFCLAMALVAANAAAQIQLSDENAYNPIPSPDGLKIVAVRTGWGRHGGSGGLGRSNLKSDLIILDRMGRTISPLFHEDRFVADWNRGGIVSFRDWSYTLLSPEGRVLDQGRVCSPELINSPFDCPERVAYLPALGSFAWVHQKVGSSVLMTPRGELSLDHHEKYLGKWLAPSPDERYIAVGPGQLGPSLNVYDLREKTWTDLGTAVIQPADGSDWMEPSWKPVVCRRFPNRILHCRGPDHQLARW